jgi:hypothetical protein
MMDASFNKMLNDEYLIPEFINPQSDYYINYLKTNTEETEETEETEASSDMSALVASIIFNNHGVVLPFQYKLTDEQFAVYEKNKHDVIDTLAWYIFDYYVCRHFVEEYGIFKIIAKVITEYGAENTAYLFKNKNEEELYRSYTYYILLEYFDNIVYLSNNKDTEAIAEDIEELEKLIKDISKNKNTSIM